MRELKFRAVYKGSLITRVFKSFCAHEMFTGQMRCEEESDYFDPSATFEQFTGLHDQYGKEIYEGDILQNKAGGYAPVIYRCGGFFVELIDCEEFGTMYVPLNEAILLADLVGNIHDNPELLEATNAR